MDYPSPTPAKHRGLTRCSLGNPTNGKVEMVDRRYFDAREDTLAHWLCDTFSTSAKHGGDEARRTLRGQFLTARLKREIQRVNTVNAARRSVVYSRDTPSDLCV